MDESAFHTACRRLATEGRRVHVSRYDEAAFGSWVIELAKPRQRIVWDAKERALSVQSKTFMRGWKDDWVAAEERDLNIDAALGHLKGG